MSFSPLIDELITALRCLPGVGPKSAQRMAFHLLQHNKPQAQKLAQALNESVENIKHCKSCHTLSETELCTICNNERRNKTMLCIVESPIDVLAIEQTSSFNGLYFVLMGHLSPIDGIGPQDLGLDLLESRLKSLPVNEVILATNVTVEGEATSHYIAEMVKRLNIKVSRLAQGVPLGGELEYINERTLAQALNFRETV